MKFYPKLHQLYRENIDLIKSCYKINDILFTHAGVSNGWIDAMNWNWELNNKSFRLNQDNITLYIENEYLKELEQDKSIAPKKLSMWPYLESPIFCVGHARGGDAPSGGPVWCDFEYEYYDPEGWNITQVFGHTQGERTGIVRQKDNGYCLDSRSIFEMDLDTKEIKRSELYLENFDI